MDHDNSNKVSEITEESVSHISNIIMLLQKKKYFSVVKEIFILLKNFYNAYIKGRTIQIANKQIPLIAIIIGVFALYIIIPSSPNVEEQNIEQEIQQNKPTNSYDKQGVKVYEMTKCENNSVCGLLENGSEKKFSRIIISVTNHDKKGNVIYEGGIEATDVAPHTRMKFSIPSEVEFDYFVLSDVTIEP